MSAEIVEMDVDYFDIRFVGESRTMLLTLSEQMNRDEPEIVTAAISLYKTLLEWREKGNYIDMVTPPRGETRDRLELP